MYGAQLQIALDTSLRLRGTCMYTSFFFFGGGETGTWTWTRYGLVLDNYLMECV